jgi:hypothetical protein
MWERRVYQTQNICEPELRHRKMVREDGKSKGGARHHLLSRGSIFLPYRTSAVWPPTCVFVTVNEARRYLATRSAKSTCNSQRSSEISCDKVCQEHV